MTTITQLPTSNVFKLFFTHGNRQPNFSKYNANIHILYMRNIYYPSNVVVFFILSPLASRIHLFLENIAMRSKCFSWCNEMKYLVLSFAWAFSII